MNGKGSRTCIDSQDVLDIIQESMVNPAPAGGSAVQRSTPLGGLFFGNLELWELRPGLRIMISDFGLDNELEVTSNLDQTMFSGVLTMEGSWNRLLKDHRGRIEELYVAAGINAAGLGPPREYKLRLEGRRRHRNVRVDISTTLLSRLIEKTGPDEANFMNSGAHRNDSFKLLARGSLTTSLACLAQEVIHCPMQAGAKRLFMEGKALEIIAHELSFFRNSDKADYGRPEPLEIERLRQAKSILDIEYADPPGLFELARRVGLNDFKLKRGFKSCFGTTIFGYIRDLRMEKARTMLDRGDMSVTEAAFAAGYNSLGYFAAAFKKRFGILPGKYRQKRSKPRL